MRLEALAGSSAEVVKLEVAVSFQSEAETLGAVFLAPQHVLREAARSRAAVGEVQELVIASNQWSLRENTVTRKMLLKLPQNMRA